MRRAARLSAKDSSARIPSVRAALHRELPRVAIAGTFLCCWCVAMPDRSFVRHKITFSVRFARSPDAHVSQLRPRLELRHAASEILETRGALEQLVERGDALGV